jgi:TPR repeat protein
MKLKWVTCVFLVLVAIAIRMPAQQSDADLKFFEDTKAKAEMGDARAQNDLGFCYHEGQGVTQDYAEAVKWYLKAANQGNAEAQFNLGTCYDHGQGVAQDYAEAVKWYRKAANQNLDIAEYNLGVRYVHGQGVTQDYVEAVKWYRKAADQGNALAQANLGVCYHDGQGVTQDYVEAIKWYRKAADQGNDAAQYDLGTCYQGGQGVPQESTEAVKWFHRAADQGNAIAQYNLGACYANGDGAAKNYIEAYKWENLASAQGNQLAKEWLPNVERRMTPEQIAEAQRRSAEFVPKREKQSSNSGNFVSPANPSFTGTGFFITDDGYLISNYHVVKDATKIRLVTSAGTIYAKVVQVDAANDLALLKADGKFSPLPISPSRTTQLGGTVATIGFPNIGMQGFSPKLAKGEIASLAGAADDPRYFQISVPVQPGNSGGALVDEHGNVIGIVSAKLDASVALAASGALPENVNYAVKSSFLLSFLESVPAVSARLKAPVTVDRKFEDVVKSAQDAAVLVLVY